MVILIFSSTIIILKIKIKKKNYLYTGSGWDLLFLFSFQLLTDFALLGFGGDFCDIQITFKEIVSTIVGIIPYDGVEYLIL